MLGDRRADHKSRPARLNVGIKLSESFFEPHGHEGGTVIEQQVNVFVRNHTSEACARMEDDNLPVGAAFVKATSAPPVGVSAKFTFAREEKYSEVQTSGGNIEITAKLRQALQRITTGFFTGVREELDFG